MATKNRTAASPKAMAKPAARPNPEPKSERVNLIRNTEAALKNDPMGSLFEIAYGSIEGQERRGQKELLESTVLPSEFFGREALEAAGVQFGSKVDGDPLFVHATIPKGWKKIATNHPMHSNLVDERGRRRASIAYKAAAYDRYASGGAVRRFSTSRDYDRKDAIVCRAMDGDRIMHEIVTPADYGVTFESKERRKWYEKIEVCEKEICAWMTERFPNWGDASAYWDLPDDVSSAT